MSDKRFGLRALLIAVALCAGMLGLIVQANRVGQQSGYDRGFDAAIRQRLSERNLLKIEYSIDDAIAKAFPDEDVDFAVADILKLVAEKAKPETWDFVGGYGTLDASKNEHNENVLVVNNSIPVHLEVSRILDNLRGAAPGIRDRSFVTKLYESKSETADTE